MKTLFSRIREFFHRCFEEYSMGVRYCLEHNIQVMPPEAAVPA